MSAIDPHEYDGQDMVYQMDNSDLQPMGHVSTPVRSVHVHV